MSAAHTPGKGTTPSAAPLVLPTATPENPVPVSAELIRVLKLPRKQIDLAKAQRTAKTVTRFYRSENGTMELFPLQALVLSALYEWGGVVAPLTTGGGKTLPGLLAPLVAGCTKPILLIPSRHRTKTLDDIEMYGQHFTLGPITIESYEKLGRVTSERLLEDGKFDMIILDEAHELKNQRSARCRRIHRYVRENPSVKVVALSGTITNRSLREYAHILDWCLRQRSPAPRKKAVVEAWAAAVDDKLSFFGRGRRSPGALKHFWGPAEQQMALTNPIGATRIALRRRMTETPGVVASTDPGLSSSLEIDIREVLPGPTALAAMERLYEQEETPCGYAIATPIDKWRRTIELQHGFYYMPDPPPPEAWLAARKAWAVVCRTAFRKHPHIRMDSEAHVALALMGRRADGRDRLRVTAKVGKVEIDGLEALRAWRAVRPTFKARNVPVWIDTTYLDAAARWAKEAPGIIWVDHVAFARELASRTGMPYYGKDGAKDAFTGKRLGKESGRRSVIASIRSAGDGLNLQMFARNLVPAPMSVGRVWEQVVSRTHRRGQKADRVTVEVWVGCAPARAAMAQAIRDAKYAEESTNNRQRLLMADMVGLRLVDLERA